MKALNELLPLCERRGTAIVIGGGFSGGILATGAVPGAKWNYAPAPAPIMEKVKKSTMRVIRFRMDQKGVRMPKLHDPVVNGRGRTIGHVTSAQDARIASGRAATDAHLLHGRGDFIAVSGGDAPIRFQVATISDPDLRAQLRDLEKRPASLALPPPRDL